MAEFERLGSYEEALSFAKSIREPGQRDVFLLQAARGCYDLTACRLIEEDALRERCLALVSRPHVARMPIQWPDCPPIEHPAGTVEVDHNEVIVE